MMNQLGWQSWRPSDSEQLRSSDSIEPSRNLSIARLSLLGHTRSRVRPSMSLVPGYVPPNFPIVAR